MAPGLDRSPLSDPLRYAFSAAGSLDPGTKLLDLGLTGVTPAAALETLLAQPLHMSVALHEITHFVSLENTLGHLMGFLAMRAKTIAEAIEERARSRQPIAASWIQLHAAWHHKYRVLLELWRPLLEGLAIYVQTHWPDQHGDSLIDPVQILVHWKVTMDALTGELSARSGDRLEQIDGGLIRAAYRSIEQGPLLLMGERPLAGALELVDPESLSPYFLGHAYVRALQRALAQKCEAYASCEAFIGLVLRILRSSARRLMEGESSWQQPRIPRRLYGWIDTVAQAPRERVAELRQQDDTVDVLHFLATGKAEPGYAGGARESISVLTQLLPDHWKSFESELAGRQFDDIARAAGDPPPRWTPNETALRIAGAWIRGSMSLNLSTDGLASVQGWIARGYDDRHALALGVEGKIWWLAVDDEGLALLAGESAVLPKLPSRALLEPIPFAPGERQVRIDSFTHYVPDPGNGHLMPAVRFAIAPESDPERILLTALAPGVPGIRRPHLRGVTDAQDTALHSSTLAMRHIVRDAPGPAELTDLCKAQGDAAAEQAFREAELSEELAAVNASDHATRRILTTLLGRTPTTNDLRLPKRGVAVVDGAATLTPLIAAAYAAPHPITERERETVERVNAAAASALGQTLFAMDAGVGTVLYCGLWGSDPARAAWVRARRKDGTP